MEQYYNKWDLLYNGKNIFFELEGDEIKHLDDEAKNIYPTLKREKAVIFEETYSKFCSEIEFALFNTEELQKKNHLDFDFIRYIDKSGNSTIKYITKYSKLKIYLDDILCIDLDSKEGYIYDKTRRIKVLRDCLSNILPKDIINETEKYIENIDC